MSENEPRPEREPFEIVHDFIRSEAFQEFAQQMQAAGFELKGYKGGKQPKDSISFMGINENTGKEFIFAFGSKKNIQDLQDVSRKKE